MFTKIMNRIFSPGRSAKSTQAGQRSKLVLDEMETRLVPANIKLFGGILTIDGSSKADVVALLTARRGRFVELPTLPIVRWERDVYTFSDGRRRNLGLDAAPAGMI